MGVNIDLKVSSGDEIGFEKILAAGPIPPTGRRGTGLRQKDDGMDGRNGAQVEMPAAEKVSLQVLYPLGGGLDNKLSL